MKAVWLSDLHLRNAQDDKICDSNRLPFFSNRLIGDMLLNFAIKYSDNDFTVLSGHTHNYSQFQPVENLTITTALVENDNPRINNSTIGYSR